MTSRGEKALETEPALPGLADEPSGRGWVDTPLPLAGGDAETEPGGKGIGRPKGAKNKRQQQLQAWLLAKGYRHPAVILAETYSRPVQDLRKALSCTKLEAYQLQLKAAEALMPYFEGKVLPKTDDGDQPLPMLNINLGTNSLAEMGVQAADNGAWSMWAQFQQNQALSRDASAAPNGMLPNDEAETLQFQEVDHDPTAD